MKRMSRARLFAMIRNDPYYAADEKIFESVLERLGPQPECPKTGKQGRGQLFRIGAAVAACLAVCAGAAYAAQNRFTPRQSSAAATCAVSSSKTANAKAASANEDRSSSAASSSGKAGGTASGAGSRSGTAAAAPLMKPYCQYRDGYYKVNYQNGNSDGDFGKIQNEIVRCLGGGVYEISGCNPAKSVAVFNGRYYYRADYAFAAGLNFGGSAYVLAPGEAPEVSPGKLLGQSGSYRLYALPGGDAEGRIAVGLGGAAGPFCVAYRMPESVGFGGKTYYLLGSEGLADFSTDGLNCLGKAGPYDVYRSDASENGRITVKIGEKQAKADAFVPSGGKPPASWYGSPRESMYPVWSDMIFGGADYRVSSSFDYIANQKELAGRVGAKLGNWTLGGYTYGVYRLRGTDPKTSVAVKNNGMYLEYDFLFSAEVKFGGAEYHITQDGFTGSVGGRIGTTEDGHEVDSVVGVDPKKEIVVVIGGGTQHAVRK